MTVVERLDSFVVGRITFPLVNAALNRRGILAQYRRLIESEQYDQESIGEIQLRKLVQVVRCAYRHCPYYTRRFKEIGLLPEDIKSLEDVKRLPPLNRKDVIDHRHEMVDSRYSSCLPLADQRLRAPGAPVWFARFRRHKLVRNVSTGSTGTPITFYENGVRSALNWAHELRLKRWYGHGPGVKEARLARVSTEYLPASKVLWARRVLWNQLILPGMNLADPEYELCLRKLREFQPKILFGITSALTGLASYIRRMKQELSGWRPELVISWAAPLFDHEKKLLTDTFHCPVSNIYGSREVGHIAVQCPQGSLHINQEDFLVETETWTKAGFAEPGEILVTPLNPSPMPFLRYRIGDLGELSDDRCACDRSLQVMKSVLGRTGEVYITKDGRMIAPNFWCRIFMIDGQSESVEKFQVVYRKNGAIRFQIVPKPSYTPAIEASIREFLAKNFDGSVSFEFEYLLEIKPQPSGKFPLVVNEDSE